MAIVTGGAGGLGCAIARRLLADGEQVIIADVRGAADAAATLGGGRVATVDVDVTSADSVTRLVDEVIARFQRIDVLVNNAGIAGPTAPITEYPLDAWRQVIAVNLDGVFHCTRACLPHMIANSYGRVVNIASIAGKDPSANMSAYSASKAAVIALTKSAAKELATSGVLVNCVTPGVIDAGLTVNTATPQERALFLSRVPMGRYGRADELAELVSWLASNRCSYTTGAAYDLSGGRAVG